MPNPDPFYGFTPQEIDDLRGAAGLLESPGFFIQVVNWLGVPIEGALKRLPEKIQGGLAQAIQTALEKALDITLYTLDPEAAGEASNWWHKLGVTATGIAGGFWGLPGVAVELPISTGIMLRSIADVARSEGEDLRSLEARLACLEVFALGGRSADDDASRSSYLLVRSMLAREVAASVEYLAERGLAEKGAPALIRLLVRIAERFGVQVNEKVAAEALPVVGAVGGGVVNLLFMNHFQDMARGHFTYRRLVRGHGEAAVEVAYERILDEARPQS